MRGPTLLVLACLAALVGCADDAPAAADASTDVADVTVDVTPPDVFDGTVDVAAPDAPRVDAGPVRCVSGADCTHDPRGPACDTATGACAPCAPRDDRCPDGQFCVEGMNRCAPGCRDDAACATAAPDGGVARAHCDVATRACVECLVGDDCPVGFRCVGNACARGCDGASRCGPREMCCEGACVDVSENLANCGVCGRACESPHAESECGGGACRLVRCVEPYSDCDINPNNGCETDTRTSTTHCGRCGAQCLPRDHASVACEVGDCVYRCDEGYADCDGRPATGCETDLRTSLSNCGACGRSCVIPFGTAMCRAGSCGVDRCDTGRADCDGDLSTGCETLTASSVTHCGACGNACAGGPHAAATCRDGRCVSSCAPGYGDCDGDPVNGCEVDFATDPRNCGSCGMACRVDHGEASCALSICGVARCEAGWGDCNGSAADGCESSLTSPAHCGSCTNACLASPGVMAVCTTAGRCDVMCGPDAANCDGDAANGCEVSTRTDPAHCGGCGRACTAPAHATATCRDSACGTSCAPGYGDCDADRVNGCETDLTRDPRNCGGCGMTQIELCDGADNDCDGRVDEGYTTTGCASLACSGAGRVATLPDGCIDDGGGSAAGDALEVYCVGGIARFCLSGEACPWRDGATTSDDVTCSRAGLASDFMASATSTCGAWNGQIHYACDAMGRVSFPP